MKILIVDDEEGIRSGLKKILEYYKYDVLESGTVSGAIKLIENDTVDCILLDLKIHDENGLEVLAFVKERTLNITVIVMTGFGDIRNAVLCMQQGAANYITKPINNELLLSILKREEDLRSNLLEKTSLEVQLQEYRDKGGVLLKSKSSDMVKILNILHKVKDSPVPVLITGDTGTGKEVTARYLHSMGNRSTEPFISLNCASLNDNLLESELFGHVKGAFTGADKDKPGRFELAGKGTLFLDELGDMSIIMQAKLLRVLQEGTYEKVGGIRTCRSECRIVAATNKNLVEQIELKEFRNDLYYRLNLVELTLPPLKDRKSDIPAFIDLFISDANKNYNKNIISINPLLRDRLVSYDWPGNIRQLKNSIDYAVLFSSGRSIDSLDIFTMESDDIGEIPINVDLKTTMDEIILQSEKKIISNCLAQCSDNIAKTARTLGVSRKTLYQKMKKYQIPVT